MHEVLRQFVTAFDMLTKEEVELIVDNADIRQFKKGTVLLREGQVARECYFVLKGLVREYYIKDGEERSTNFYTEMQPVNSFTSHTQGKPSQYFLVCAEDCVVTVGNDSLEQEMCKRIPRLEGIIRQEVEQHTGKVQDDMAKFITSSPEERYMNLLENRPELLNRVPQHQIAGYLGMKPESLSRIRKRLLKTK